MAEQKSRYGRDARSQEVKRAGVKLKKLRQTVFAYIERVVSSVGLECLLDRQEVAGSTPVQPTCLVRSYLSLVFSFKVLWTD